MADVLASPISSGSDSIARLQEARHQPTDDEEAEPALAHLLSQRVLARAADVNHTEEQRAEASGASEEQRGQRACTCACAHAADDYEGAALALYQGEGDATAEVAQLHSIHSADRSPVRVRNALDEAAASAHTSLAPTSQTFGGTVLVCAADQRETMRGLQPDSDEVVQSAPIPQASSGGGDSSRSALEPPEPAHPAAPEPSLSQGSVELAPLAVSALVPTGANSLLMGDTALYSTDAAGEHPGSAPGSPLNPSAAAASSEPDGWRCREVWHRTRCVPSFDDHATSGTTEKTGVDGWCRTRVTCEDDDDVDESRTVTRRIAPPLSPRADPPAASSSHPETLGAGKPSSTLSVPAPQPSALAVHAAGTGISPIRLRLRDVGAAGQRPPPHASPMMSPKRWLAYGKVDGLTWYATRVPASYRAAMVTWHTLLVVVCHPLPPLGHFHVLDLEQHVQSWWTAVLVQLAVVTALALVQSAHDEPISQAELVVDAIVASVVGSAIGLAACRLLFFLGGPAGHVRQRDGRVSVNRLTSSDISSLGARTLDSWLARERWRRFVARWLHSCPGWLTAWSVSGVSCALAVVYAADVSLRKLGSIFGAWALAQAVTWLLTEPFGIACLVVLLAAYDRYSCQLVTQRFRRRKVLPVHPITSRSPSRSPSKLPSTSSSKSPSKRRRADVQTGSRADGKVEAAREDWPLAERTGGSNELPRVDKARVTWWGGGGSLIRLTSRPAATEAFAHVRSLVQGSYVERCSPTRAPPAGPRSPAVTRWRRERHAVVPTIAEPAASAEARKTDKVDAAAMGANADEAELPTTPTAQLRSPRAVGPVPAPISPVRLSTRFSADGQLIVDCVVVEALERSTSVLDNREPECSHTTHASSKPAAGDAISTRCHRPQAGGAAPRVAPTVSSRWGSARWRSVPGRKYQVHPEPGS